MRAVRALRGTRSNTSSIWERQRQAFDDLIGAYTGPGAGNNMEVKYTADASGDLSEQIIERGLLPATASDICRDRQPATCRNGIIGQRPCR